MWSFPIVKDGLIYAVDIRNGLYILRYEGPHQKEVSEAKFLDGNSNSGDIQKLEPVDEPGPAAPREAAPAKPIVGDGRACLAPARLRGKQLGPFSLGTSAATVALRGGPAERSAPGRRRYCVEGGSGVEVLLRRNRVAVLLRALARPPRRGGGDRVTVRRGRASNRVSVIRGGKLVATGIAQRGLSKRTLRALIARTAR